MQKVLLPIRMYSCHDEEGNILPLRFRAEDEREERFVVQIEKVLLQEEVKVAGRRMINYRCRGLNGRKMNQYELSFELASCRWYLALWS